VVAEPHVIDAHTIALTASIGIALYPQDGQDVTALLLHADSAMYAAKRNGRNLYRFYDASLTRKVDEA